MNMPINKEDSHICKREEICVAQDSPLVISMLLSDSKTDCKFDVDFAKLLDTTDVTF